MESKRLRIERMRRVESLVVSGKKGKLANRGDEWSRLSILRGRGLFFSYPTKVI